MGADEAFLGIAGYTPRHVESIAELGGDRDRLRSLVGRTLTGSLAMWETTDDEWFTDGPLILRFDAEVQLELAGFKLHICLSWNAIDVDQPIEWFPGSSFRLAWREDALPALARLRGKPIEEVTVIDYRGGFNGVGFRTADAYAEVFNALDELGVTGSHAGSDLAIQHGIPRGVRSCNPAWEQTNPGSAAFARSASTPPALGVRSCNRASAQIPHGTAFAKVRIDAMLDCKI